MIAQIGIALTGMLAIWLTQQPNKDWQRYACLFGMAAQPFWYYSAYTAEQWGILAMSVVYTYSWWIGIKTHWIN